MINIFSGKGYEQRGYFRCILMLIQDYTSCIAVLILLITLTVTFICRKQKQHKGALNSFYFQQYNHTLDLICERLKASAADF